jgi:predicted dehydrogenase
MKLKIALIGAGQRGMGYADFAFHSKEAEIVAIVEPNEERRKIAAENFLVPEGMCFSSTEEFFHKGRVADAAIIASMDKDHYEQTMAALELGYDILLEKPISPQPRECLEIQEKAKQKGCRVIVCHVLRYTNFFTAIKNIIDSGELGRVISIQHNENIGNFHMAHSFVRGNWRRSDETSPLIMQKSCHDMDILTWLVGSKAKKISSFGSLRYFREENAPENSSDRCLTCTAAKDCRFDARKVYLPIVGQWPAGALTADQTREGIEKAITEGPYGRCVYRCDNDVCDNQVVLIEFENQVTVSFNLSGFTGRISRTIKVMCENGEIRGDDSKNIIEVTKFASNPADPIEQRFIEIAASQSGHGGGDSGLMEDFLQQLITPGDNSRSSVSQSVQSHMMAYAAEQSRVTGKVIDLDEMTEELRNS